MIISGVNSGQNYSFLNMPQAAGQKASETQSTDKYIPSSSETTDMYNMFGNIQKNVFDSFASGGNFLDAIRDVFNNIEDQVLSSESLTEAAKISDAFQKKGEWLSISSDGKYASIKDADNVYYDGNETNLLVSDSNNVVLNGLKGRKDALISRSSNVISNTGSGADRMWVSNSKNVIINSGAGNDGAMVSNSKNVIIDSGEGNSGTSVHGSNSVAIKNGSGRDNATVSDSSNVAIDSGGGDDWVRITGSNGVAVNSGAGKDSAEIYGSDNVSVHAGDDEDKAKIYDSSNVWYDGGSGNDDVYVTSSNNVSIDGGSGNDIISIQNSENIRVYGGDGDDNISVMFSTGAVINGGTGNDTITGSGVISGGTGDDYIKLYHSIFNEDSQDVIKYSRGDGHDIVDGVTEDTVIELNGISEDEYDVIESMGANGGKVKTITMKDGSGSITLNYSRSASVVEVQKGDRVLNKKEDYIPDDGAGQYTRLADVNIL